MKVKGLKINIKLDDNKLFNRKEADIEDGMISISFITNRANVTMLEYCKITDYKSSKTIMRYSDNKYNSYVKFKRLDESEIRVMTNLTWLEKQKLYLMMGDHIVTKNGNFKWLIGGLLGFLFYLYTNKQDTKFQIIINENVKLKDSLSFYTVSNLINDKIEISKMKDSINHYRKVILWQEEVLNTNQAKKKKKVKQSSLPSSQ